MRTGSKITLGTLLGLINGYFLGAWRFDWMNTDDVGRQWIRLIIRQWIRLIIPVMMLVSSVGIIVVVWFSDRIAKKKTDVSSP